MFVSFFPQLIQGPIARFDQLENQLVTPHHFDLKNIECGLLLMLWGWFKKKVIADRALTLVNAVFVNQSAYGGAVIVVGVLFYSLQQYADFSGGMPKALGLAARDYHILLLAALLLFVVSFMQERGVKIRDFMLSCPLALRWAMLYAFILFVLATFGGPNVASSGFMYAVF